ncbi:MAG: hypothetical protein IPI73_26405 [Betaproteobacteria bacterium]|nr:hypothetical protein [Betaproteobacteria bacterium]
MRSATIGIQYLLASRGLEFSTITGFTKRRSTNEEREAQLCDTEYVDRSYWSDYDYFMHARDLRALRRARVHASVSAFFKRLLARLTGARVRPVFTEHSRA